MNFLKPSCSKIIVALVCTPVVFVLLMLLLYVGTTIDNHENIVELFTSGDIFLWMLYLFFDAWLILLFLSIAISYVLLEITSVVLNQFLWMSKEERLQQKNTSDSIVARGLLFAIPIFIVAVAILTIVAVVYRDYQFESEESVDGAQEFAKSLESAPEDPPTVENNSVLSEDQNKIKRSQEGAEESDSGIKKIFDELNYSGIKIRYPAGKPLRDCQENDWVRPEYTQSSPDFFCKTNGSGLVVLGFRDQDEIYEKYFSGNARDISMSPYFSSGFGFERKIESLNDENNDFAGWIYFGSIHQDVPGSIDLQVVKKQDAFLVYYNQKIFDFENSEWSIYFHERWAAGEKNYEKIFGEFVELNQKLFDNYYNQFAQIYSY